MPDIVALLHCIELYVPATTLRQFSCIISAVLAMTGRVTMLGISRWTGQGGSYRTVQRFFSIVLPWAMLFWVFFRQHLHRPDDVYILAGDEVVVSKAGHHTHGLDRFFAGVYGRVIPGLAFFSLALISTQQRRSFPVRVEQVVRSEAEKAASRAKAAAKKAPKPACVCQMKGGSPALFVKVSGWNQHTMTEQVKAGSTVQRALDQFESVDLAFDLAVAPGQS